MGKIKDVLDGVVTTEALLIENALNNLIKNYRSNSEDRIGMHGSGIIASDNAFCYREQVLAFFYKGKEPNHPVNLLRIFLEGWSVHQKWQMLFEKAGVSLGVEQRGHSRDFELLFTPDAIIFLSIIGCRKYVVEIKSMNTFAFKHAKSHPSGEKQCQLYMHMLAIPNGFVLLEDKNSQDIKVIPVRYNWQKALPFVERMITVKGYVKEYKESDYDDEKLPMRECKNENDKRAKGCRYCQACFHKKSRVLLPQLEEGQKCTSSQ